MPQSTCTSSAHC